MFITVNGNDYELATKLGVSVKIEQKFNRPLTQIFNMVATANVSELITIITLSAKTDDAKTLKDEIINNWDYTDLQNAVQELLARLMFSGDNEEVEAKIEKYPMGEEQKNLIRGMLGIPLKLSEQPTE